MIYSHESKMQAVANTISKKQCNGESIFQFIDNGPEAFIQKLLSGENRCQISIDSSYKYDKNNLTEIK